MRMDPKHANRWMAVVIALAAGLAMVLTPSTSQVHLLARWSVLVAVILFFLPPADDPADAITVAVIAAIVGVVALVLVALIGAALWSVIT